MCETGHSKPVHWENMRDGMGKEVGGGFRTGETCTPMADSCQSMAKTSTILLKKKKKKSYSFKKLLLEITLTFVTQVKPGRGPGGI